MSVDFGLGKKIVQFVELEENPQRILKGFVLNVGGRFNEMF
tara:strand:- start:134 stop:256 length:123 start_codon:yes stop_codon:yes gene_type:complete